MGLFENRSKKARKLAQKEQARQATFAGQRQAEIEYAQQRQTSAQEAQMKLFGMLGAPGTYDLPGTGGAGVTTSSGGLYKTGVGPSGSAKATAGRGGVSSGMLDDMASSQMILDPDAYAQQIAGSTAFRTQSRMQAEAEQLLAQQGPAWDMLANSTLGNISESAAELTRESVRQVKNAAAKGGTARRQALSEAQSMLAQEAGMRLKAQETWKANLALFEYTRNYASKVQAESQNFLNNLPLINQSYQGAMDNLTSIMASSITASASASQRATETVMEGYYNEKGGFLEGLILAGISLVGSAVGAPGLGQIIGEATGSFGAGGTAGEGGSGLSGLISGGGLDKYGDWGLVGDAGAAIKEKLGLTSKADVAAQAKSIIKG